MIRLLRFVSIRVPRTSCLLSPTNSLNPAKIISRNVTLKGIPNLMNQSTLNSLRIKDKIPKDYELIYRAGTIKYIRYGYPVAVLSFIALSSSFIYFNYFFENMSYPATAGLQKNQIAYRSAKEVNITYIAYIAMSVLTILILKRMIMRVWHNPVDDTYKMILVKTLPPFKRCVNFKPGELYRKNPYPKHALQEVIHWHKRSMYYITMVDFRSPADYYKMIGHDCQRDDELE